MSGKALHAWLANSRASARFLSHGGGSPYALRDLRSLTTSKFIHQPTGGWSATLHPTHNEDYLNKIIDRIPYSNPDTRQKMEDIRTHLAEFIHTSPGYTWN